MPFRSTVLSQFLALFFCCFCLGGLASCGSSNDAQTGFQLTGSFPLCHALDSVGLYTVDGFSLRRLVSAPLFKSEEEARFVMQGSVPAEGLYLLGKAPDNLMSIIVGGEYDVHISGTCENLRQIAKVSGSPANEDLAIINLELAQMRQSKASVQEKQRLLDSLHLANPLLAKRVALDWVDPFDFTHSTIDLGDSAYFYMSLLPEYISIYTQTIFRASPSKELAEQSIDQILAQMIENSPTYKNSLAAIIRSLDRLGSPSFLKYIQMYQARYEFLDRQAEAYFMGRIQHFEEQAEAESRLAVGELAPAIQLPTPSGSLFSLTDLRGKVVLLAFWASWSEASSAAHPWMKQVYQAYKGKGFEILEVSLDQSHQAWIQAIAQDGCSWVHVADRNFEENSASKHYHVQSIPMTFLLDRNGKIIGKNLQRSTLEVKLAELFE